MQLNRAGLADKSAWEAKGYALPSFDYETVQKTYNALKNWWSSANYVVYDYTEKGKHELMPIPQREMDLCTQFEQNPGW